MLKFYIVDDDLSVIKILENIIEDNSIGEIAGYSLNGLDALRELILTSPDIALVDLLMPEKDGVDLVKEAIENDVNTKFIMISQVSSKPMISKAYSAGIEFFINKPVNKIEAMNVIKKVSERIQMEKKLNTIESIFKNTEHKNEEGEKADDLRSIKLILNRLGILGEKGTEDILMICTYLIQKDESIYDYKIKDLCDILSENPNAMEQRLRRAINKALVNIANIGIEDYMNPVFTRYSNSIFNFEDVKAQMDNIRGKRSSGGKISIRRFIDNILHQSQLEND